MLSNLKLHDTKKVLALPYDNQTIFLDLFVYYLKIKLIGDPHRLGIPDAKFASVESSTRIDYYSLVYTSTKASTKKATHMNNENISSVDRVDHFIILETLKNENIIKKNVFHNPTQQYIA